MSFHSKQRKISLFNLCPCFHQDVPPLSSPVHAAISAVQGGDVAAYTRANPMSFMTLNMGAGESRCGADGRIQQSSFGESRESCREVYSQEEQPLEYGGMDGLVLPDVFLHQYYSQVRHCETVQVINLLFG